MSYPYKRTRVICRLEESFDTLPDDLDGWTEIRPDDDAEIKVETSLLERKQMRADLSQTRSLRGALRNEIKMKLAARSAGTVVGTGEDACYPGELSHLLRATLGDGRIGQGAILQEGTTSTTGVLSSDPAATCGVGDLAMVGPDANGAYVPCAICRIDSVENEVHWDWGGRYALSSASVGDTLATSVSFMPSAINGRTLSLQQRSMPMQGVYFNRYLNGIVGNVKIDDAVANERVLLEFDLHGVSHDVSEDGELFVDEAHLVPASVHGVIGGGPYAVSPPDLLALSGGLRIDGTAYAYYKFGFDPGIEYPEKHDVSALQGLAPWDIRSYSPKIALGVYFAESHHGAYRDGSIVSVLWNVGNAANGIAFHAPACEVRVADEEEVNGRLAQSLELTPLDPNEYYDASVVDAGCPDWTLSFFGKDA